jgi:hypothetical protein
VVVDITPLGELGDQDEKVAAGDVDVDGQRWIPRGHRRNAKKFVAVDEDAKDDAGELA